LAVVFVLAFWVAAIGVVLAVHVVRDRRFGRAQPKTHS
jgi:hypothetical protein